MAFPPVRALRHEAHRKRRLYAGRLEAAYLREERRRRLAEGHMPRRRKLYAGRVNAAYKRELRILKGETTGTGRELYARHLRGEFGGEHRDPRVPRR